jgi:hypothetical protein
MNPFVELFAIVRRWRLRRIARRRLREILRRDHCSTITVRPVTSYPWHAGPCTDRDMYPARDRS